jgi:hypothetical protein
MLYTDGFSMFGYEGEDHVTKCGRMLLALQIAHRIAPTPQAKGKVERLVETLQRRLVPLLIQEGVCTQQDTSAVVDPHISYWNEHHKHRTTGMTANAAHILAIKEGRSVYRPCPSHKLMDLHIAYHQPRLVSSAYTIDYHGRSWKITPTGRKKVALVIHPDQRFWVVEKMPDPRNPGWPNVLAKYTI